MGFSDAPGGVHGGIAQDMVELVCEYAPKGPAVRFFTAFDRHGKQSFLHKSMDALAIDIGEREDDAVTDMGPAERAGIGTVGYQAGDVASALEGNDGQLHRDGIAARRGQVPPGEAQAAGRHDGIYFILECIEDGGQRLPLEFCVQSYGRQSFLVSPECRQGCQHQTERQHFHSENRELHIQLTPPTHSRGEKSN